MALGLFGSGSGFGRSTNFRVQTIDFPVAHGFSFTLTIFAIIVSSSFFSSSSSESFSDYFY